MIQAQPLRIHAYAEPTILHFEVENGAIVCASHPESGVGGGVLLPESASARMRTIVWGLMHEIARLSDCPAEKVEIKIAGPKRMVDALRAIVREMKLHLKGEAIDSGKLVAYFYTNSGRLRLQSDSSAPETARPETAQEPVSRRKRVLIVDDSPSIRKVLEHILSSDPDLEVVGSLGDPAQAEEAIAQLSPDVVTLDIHMPGMDGVTLLERILKTRALPAVMITSLSMEESDLVLRALELGAVDYIQKPSFEEISSVGPAIAERVRSAAGVRVRVAQSPTFRRLGASDAMDSSILIAMGASTGGTEALRAVLTRMPDQIPPIAIVQHIPPVFSGAFARRLNELCPFEVKEAEDGDLLAPNRVLIAPGGLQMRIVGTKPPYRVRITDEPAINRHKPSVDALFDSVAAVAGAHAVGVLMTGMGADGARGLMKMRQAGARTLAQSEQSCVVFGMPKEAIKLGAAEYVCDLDDIAATLLELIHRDNKAA